MATLVRRIQEKPTPVIEVEPSVPKMLNDVVMKMIATSPEDRQQSAGDLLAELDAYEAQRTGRTVMNATAPAGETGIPLKYVALAIVFLIGLGGWLYKSKLA